MDRMEFFLISMAARRANCHERTVRNYLRAGLLSVERVPSGIHLFTEDDVARIKEIRATRKVGRPRKTNRDDVHER